MNEKNNLKKSEKIEYNQINLRVPKSIKEDWVKYARQLLGKKNALTEFISEAVRERIEKIDHPEYFQISLGGNEKYHKILSLQEKLLREYEEISKNNELIKNIAVELKEIRQIIAEKTVIENEKIKLYEIKELLTQKRTIKELIDKTGFSQKLVLTLIAILEKNNEIEEDPINGRFTLI